MCPLCITTAVLSAAGATSGVIAAAVSKWEALQRCFRSILRNGRRIKRDRRLRIRDATDI
jgi:hypothetical protein